MPDDLPPSESTLWTRRQYLTLKAIEGGAGVLLAREAVATTALEHPEWDMSEERTWKEWERA